MSKCAEETYPPLNTLKTVCDSVWIVDGPLIHYTMPWPKVKMAFPTRMTVVRVGGGDGGGDLFIHSPTPLVPELKAEIEKTGRPRWIIGPNRIHYWWIPDWKAAFPDADCYLAPRIREQAGGRIDFDTLPLDRDGGYPWDAEIATLPITGDYMTEVEFFHRPSQTLILTDFIENFEGHKMNSRLMRWFARLGGVLDPNGQMPRDMRLSFGKHKPQLKAAIQKLISYDPERVILAHGRWYDRNGADELRRSFRWLIG